MRTQRQDAGAGALTSLDAQRRILDNQALGRLHPQCLHGTQVDLGVGLKRTALVTADGVVQHVGDTGNLHQLVDQLAIGRARDGTLHAALVQCAHHRLRLLVEQLGIRNGMVRAIDLLVLHAQTLAQLNIVGHQRLPNGRLVRPRKIGDLVKVEPLLLHKRHATTVVEPLGIDQHAVHVKQHCLDHTHLLPPAKKGQVYFGRFYLGFCGATDTPSPEQKRGRGANPIPSQSTRKVYLLVISRKASTCSDAWSAGADGPRRSGCRTRA